VAAMMTRGCKRHTYAYDSSDMHLRSAIRACRHGITPQPNADLEVSEAVLWANTATRTRNTVRTKHLNK